MPAVNIKKDQYDVRIDRKTKWGNPFFMRSESERAQVIEQFRTYLWAEIQAGRITLTELATLKDKRLGCHCAPKACHGDVLSTAADWAHQQIGKKDT